MRERSGDGEPSPSSTALPPSWDLPPPWSSHHSSSSSSDDRMNLYGSLRSVPSPTQQRRQQDLRNSRQGPRHSPPDKHSKPPTQTSFLRNMSDSDWRIVKDEEGWGPQELRQHRLAPQSPEQRRPDRRRRHTRRQRTPERSLSEEERESAMMVPMDSSAKRRGPLLREHKEAYSSSSPQARSSSAHKGSMETRGPLHVQLAERALIGKGSSGKVFSAMDIDTNRLIAVKEIPLGLLPLDSSTSHDSVSQRRSSCVFTTEQGSSALAELELLKQLDHPNIVRYLGEETDLEAGCLRIYMDLVSGGSVRSLLSTYGKLQENQAASYTQQMLSGLAYLHSKHIVHRDLKGDNLLVEPSGVLKLADFGTAGAVSTVGSSKGVGGTAFFMSPEVLTSENRVTEKSDIWSAACCVLEMLVGKPPLAQLKEQYAIMMMIAQSEGEIIHHYLPSERKSWSPELLDFLYQCLRRQPAERPSASELLHHPWIVNCATRPVERDADGLYSVHRSPHPQPPQRTSQRPSVRSGAPSPAKPREPVEVSHSYNPRSLREQRERGKSQEELSSRSCNAEAVTRSFLPEMESELDITYPQPAQDSRTKKSRGREDSRHRSAFRDGKTFRGPIRGEAEEVPRLGDHHTYHVRRPRWTDTTPPVHRLEAKNFLSPSLLSPRHHLEWDDERDGPPMR